MSNEKVIKNVEVSPQNKANNLKKMMDLARKEIEAALPKHVTPDRMLRIAMTEARKNPKLLDCDQASFLGAVIQASQLGLEPGGALGHCYLIPFENRATGKLEVNFIPGYRGYIDLAMRSDRTSHVIARAVHEGDVFRYRFGLEELLEHEPLGDEESPITHVYCIVFLKNGGRLFDVMSIAQVEKVRSRSKSPNKGPWVSDYEAMSKKTIIRQLFKFMPVSIEVQRAVGLDDLDHAGEGQGNGAFINTTGRPVNPGINDLQSQIHGQPPKEGDFAAFEAPTPVEEIK